MMPVVTPRDAILTPITYEQVFTPDTVFGTITPALEKVLHKVESVELQRVTGTNRVAFNIILWECFGRNEEINAAFYFF